MSKSRKVSPQVEVLMQIILGVPGQKIVTVAKEGETLAFDVTANGKIDFEPGHPADLRQVLDQALKGSGSLIIRRFLHLQVEHTTPSGEKMWIPQKKLYGAFLQNGQFFGLKAAQLRETFSYDHATGAPLPPEPAELYCDFPGIT